MKRQTTQTFSLIELLISMSIILLLLSLITPAIQSTIRSATNIACASNLKTLAVLFDHFAEDHDTEYLNNESLFKLNRYGEIYNRTPIMRRSFRGWPSDLLSYDDSLENSVYCPADRTASAIAKSTSSNASVSYEFKSALIDLSRDEFKRSVKIEQFAIPARQSLLMSRETFHIEKSKGHHQKYDIFLMHNMLFVDGHISLDFTGYNHPNILDAKMNWLNYPVYQDNSKARGKTDYLENRCEVEENAL